MAVFGASRGAPECLECWRKLPLGWEEFDLAAAHKEVLLPNDARCDAPISDQFERLLPELMRNNCQTTCPVG
jgi:hypothetical protein